MEPKASVLIITGDAGESYETLYAKHRLQEAGYRPVIAAPSKKRLNLVMHDFDPEWDTYVEKPGYRVESDTTFEFVNPEKYVAILIIGGRAPEYLRHDPKVLEIVKAFAEEDKYIFAICHGVQVLIAAELLDHRQVSCYENIRYEVEAGGGTYVEEEEATQDGKIVTGKTWQSHPEFYRMVMTCLEKIEVLVESEK